jgi:NAD(P)-dependent dehydrogenase (short-subunit alcohol dehydrogenase family)
MNGHDRVVVVTGAGSGLGREVTHAVLGAGYRVALAGRREEALRETVDGAGVAPDRAIVVPTNVADREAVAALFARVRDELGRVDVLFNNAGISPTDDGSVLETGLEAWQRVQDVNLKSVFLCCKHGIPHLLESGGGSVINTASFVATMGAATSQISYSASKGGVLAMSRELGVQFAKQGVRVNALCPGPVDTPLLRELFAKDPVAAARRLVHVPMGRFARAEEIAAAALFLASDEASYVNASTFLVDGGISGAYVTPE